MINFLLDENVNPRLQRAVRSHPNPPTVRRVGRLEAPPRGTLDPEILLWCEANDFVLVTKNRASMPVHLREHLQAGRHVPGILILSNKLALGETAEDLYLIAVASQPEEYADLIRHLPISR